MTGTTVRELFGNLPADFRGFQNLESLSEQVLPTNLHVHLPPNFGSIATINHAIDQARTEQIAVLGACNYYDHTIYAAFAEIAIKSGIVPVFGVEFLTMDAALQSQGIRINDPQNPGRLYLCGKGLTQFDLMREPYLSQWTQIRERDKRRIELMIGKINEIELFKRHNIRLGYASIARQIAEEKQVSAATVFLQERHLVQALQRAIFNVIPAPDRDAFFRQLYQTDVTVEVQNMVKIQDELRSHLLKQGRAAYIEEQFVTPEAAAELILGLGGYVSYPVLIDGAPQILPGEGTPEQLVKMFIERQWAAAEFIPTRNDPEVLATYVNALRQAGIVVGAGTEHNAAAWIPLRVQCRKGVPVSEDINRIFWEGACVAVAHQYLAAQGEDGFRFFADCESREAQIQRMAAIGAGVIEYLRTRQLERTPVSCIGKQRDELKQWLGDHQRLQALETCVNAPLVPLPDNFTPPTRMPWGGTNILGKYKQRRPIRPEKRYPIVGESWEISADPISPSQFIFHLGTEEILIDLIQLLDLFPEQVLGKKMAEKFSGQNPLLVKLIDAADDLSVQVHPSDDYNGLTPDESGKPESWYVIAAEPGGGLYLGLKDGVTPAMLRHALESRGDVSQYLNFVEVQPGDFVVIDAGTIHAIGKGVTVIEPQKIAPRKSGKTYRVWDWNRTYDAQGRLDLHGTPRELHIEHAFRVINFSGLRGDEFVRHICPERRIVQQHGASVETVCVESENFGVSQLVLENGDALRGNCQETLHGIIVYEGELEICTRENRVTRVPCGQSVVLPAILGEYTITSPHANAVKVYYPPQYLYGGNG